MPELKSYSYNGAHWLFSWSSSKTSTPGLTEVSWTLTSAGRTSAPTWYATTGTFECSYTDSDGKSKTITLDISSDNSKYQVVDSNQKTYINYNNVKQDSGTFVCKHNSSGAASFTAKFTISKIYTTFSPAKTTSQTFSLDSNMPYNVLSAPSGLTITDLLEPGETFNIQWNAVSGASGYKTIYKWTNKDCTDPEQYTSTAWSREYSRSVTNDTYRSGAPTRGHKLWVKVCAVSPGGSEYQSAWSTPVAGRINQRPARPAVTALNNDYVVSNSGGTIVFTTTPGQDPEGAACSVYWGSSIDTPEANRSKCDNNTLSKNFSDNSSIYFWTYDGKAFSEDSTSIQITKNTLPTIVLTTSSGASFLDGVSTLTATSNKSSCRYNFGYRYKKNNESNWHSYTLIENQQSNSYVYDDLRYLLCKAYSGPAVPLQQGDRYTFQVWAECWDGKDFSGVVTRDVLEYVVPTVSLQNNATVSDFPSHIFGDAIRVTLENVNSSHNYKNIAIDGSNFYPLTSFAADINTKSFPYGGAVGYVTLNGATTDPAPRPFYIAVSWKKVNSFQQDYLAKMVYDKSTFNPLSSTGGLTMSFQSITNLHQYGFSNSPKLYLRHSEKDIECDFLGESNGYYMYFISNKDLWNEYGRDWLDPTAINLSFGIVDVFGVFRRVIKNHEYSKLDLPLEIVSFTSFCSEGSEHIPLDYWNFLVKDQTVYCELRVVALDKPGVSLQYSIGSMNNSSSLSYTKVQGNQTHNNWNCPLNEYQYSYSFKIPTIALDGNLTIMVNATANGAISIQQNLKDGFGKIVSVPVPALKQPKGQFTKLEVNGNTLTYEYSIIDHGIDITKYSPKTSLIGIRAKDGKTYAITNDNGEITGFSFDGAEFVHLAPILKTTIQPTYTNGATGTSSFSGTMETTTDHIYTIVYNIVPTVSYRRNTLGINTLSPETHDGAVLVISQASDEKKKVFLCGGDRVVDIDLSTGMIDNLIIDCGAWI